MADKPVGEVVAVDAVLGALSSPTSSDVYEALLPFSNDAVGAVAAKRALAAGGGGAAAPVTREAFTGGGWNITDGSTGQLPWVHDSGDTLLNLTDPHVPTVVESGVYAVGVSIVVLTPMTVGGCFGASIELDWDNLDQTVTTQSRNATAAQSQPSVAMSFTHYIPAGMTVVVNVSNYDGAATRPFTLNRAYVQRLA